MVVLAWIGGALAALIAVGNLAILAAHLSVRGRLKPGSSLPVDIENGVIVSEGLWRSGKPGPDGYAALASSGLGTAVDLRAEGGLGPAPGDDVTHIRIPIRDGQPPTPAQVERINEAITSAARPVLVHCSAGVGRTGSALAAYRVLIEGAAPRSALAEALAMGPPSLEQIAFILRLSGGARRPPLSLIALSRLLDAPRRIWSRIRAMARRLF